MIAEGGVSADLSSIFDGVWISKAGPVWIKDGCARYGDKVGTFSVESANRCSIVMDGKTSTAAVHSKTIYWHDGDVWNRPGGPTGQR